MLLGGVCRAAPHARPGAPRHLSARAAPATAQAADPPAAPQPVFDGPKAGILRLLKACSVANLAFSVVSSPAAVVLSTAGTPTTRLLMMGTVVAFSVSTTALLHLATKPYVVSIHRVAPSRVSVATVGFFGHARAREYELAALGPAGSAMLFANMAAADGTSFYVDPVGEVRDEATMALVRKAMERKCGTSA
ncbi:hypothetical protein KFE25_007375 [Diacronema lutheri]|uniref:Uncharacterized protein n=2 Tax=Diacronema lutheri TaxID=2081491 RepID=A0A8J5XUY1_DIALT|nr:hypothetical protein KFE25_007375 [Diacronema lutheri]